MENLGGISPLIPLFLHLTELNENWKSNLKMSEIRDKEVCNDFQLKEKSYELFSLCKNESSEA